MSHPLGGSVNVAPRTYNYPKRDPKRKEYRVSKPRAKRKPTLISNEEALRLLAQHNLIKAQREERESRQERLEREWAIVSELETYRPEQYL